MSLEWFPLYASKFINDELVRPLSYEELGEYFMMLCLDWINKGIKEQTFNGCSTNVQQFFVKDDESGKYFNPRLSKERGIAKKKHKQCVDAGKASAETRRKQQDVLTDDERPLNDSPAATQHNTVPYPTKQTPKDSSFPKEFRELAESLRDRIQENNPTAIIKESQVNSWILDVDKMIRIDKRTCDEINELIKWCQLDSFWQSNILSMGKLRKQFDQLTAKSKAVDEYGPIPES